MTDLYKIILYKVGGRGKRNGFDNNITDTKRVKGHNRIA
jgi:hypothetical protein